MTMNDQPSQMLRLAKLRSRDRMTARPFKKSDYIAPGMVKTLGYVLFILCCLAWLLILVIPWLGFSKAGTAGIITGLIIFGEVSFYASILLLGKTFYEKIKSKLKFRKKDVRQE